jgi:DNA-binding CsgD family transcriptional regulator
MTEMLEGRDVRALLRLLSELREMGADPAAWRGHLATNLEVLCGAGVVILAELRKKKSAPEEATNCGQAVHALQSIDCGLDSSTRERFYRDVYFTDHTTDDALGAIVPLYGTAFTVERCELIDDRGWERSATANDRFRVFGYDDFILSMAPVWPLDVICSLEIFRAPGKRFTARERLLVSLLHEELSNDWHRADRAAAKRLTARQRQVLSRLAEGASEKEITYDLGLSAHTTHDHVKAIYRAFDVRSRGELLATLTKREPPRTRLVAELPKPM